MRRADAHAGAAAHCAEPLKTVRFRIKKSIYQERHKENHEIRCKHCLHLSERVHTDGPVCQHNRNGPSGAQAGSSARVDEIVSKMTLEEKVDYIGGTGFAMRAMPNLKLPSFEMSDGPYGVRSNAGFPSTTYAIGIGLAASWDPALAERVGAGIGRDARARGVHYMLGPGVNIYRSPRNGRNFEYFGEDPFLSAAIAVGYIEGMQKQGVSATIKHFMGNNSEYLRHDSDSIIDERTMREIYLPVFEAAVKRAKVGAIMDSYNLTNGVHMTQNGYLNIDVVRKDWGFKGVMMSDWVATYDGVGRGQRRAGHRDAERRFYEPEEPAAGDQGRQGERGDD